MSLVVSSTKRRWGSDSPKDISSSKVWFLWAMISWSFPFFIIPCAQLPGSLEEATVVLVWSMSGGSSVRWRVAWYVGLIRLGMSSVPWARCRCQASGYLKSISRARHLLRASILHCIQRGILTDTCGNWFRSWNEGFRNGMLCKWQNQTRTQQQQAPSSQGPVRLLPH